MAAASRFTVALLGTTHPHASARVMSFRSIPGVEVTLAADPDEDVTAFVTAYDLVATTVDAIIDDEDVDAVLIHSYSKDMVPLAKRAVRAGKHVLVEKPGGADVAGIRELAEMRTDRVVQIGYNCRFSEGVTRATRLFREGAIGTLVGVNAHGAARVGEHLAEHLNHPEDMGGGLWVIGCHVLDIVLSICGVPETVNGRVGKTATLSDDRSREDSASAILDYGDFIATYDFDVHDPLEWFETSRVTLQGTHGVIEMGILPSRLEVCLTRPFGGLPAGWTRWAATQFATPWAKDEDNAFSELPELANLDFFRTEAETFLRSVRDGLAPAIGATDSLDLARTIEAIYRSSEGRGAPIPVGATQYPITEASDSKERHS